MRAPPCGLCVPDVPSIYVAVRCDLAAFFYFYGPPDDTQVTELAAEQQSSVSEEDGFVFSDTF